MNRSRPLPTNISEVQFQSLVIELFTIHGWKHYHTHNSRRSVAGFPDLVLVRSGTVVFAEVKRQGGRATPEQEEWLRELDNVQLENNSVYVRLWRPSDWPKIEQIAGNA